MKSFIDRHWELIVAVAILSGLLAVASFAQRPDHARIPDLTVEEKILCELILIKQNTGKLRSIEEQRMKEIPIFLKKGGLPGVAR